MTSSAKVVETVSSRLSHARCFARSWLRGLLSSGNSHNGRMERHAAAHRYANERSELNNKLTADEREYLSMVKSLSCGVCGASGPSEAHHIEQHKQYLCIPLCADCHRGGFNGLHGQRRIWNVMKKTELSVLNDTIKRIIHDQK